MQILFKDHLDQKFMGMRDTCLSDCIIINGTVHYITDN